MTEKSTQDFSDLDLSIDIKYLSCRLRDFDLCHLIMNCWKPDTRSIGLKCFHSSEFASSTTLHKRGNMKLKCSSNHRRDGNLFDESEARKLLSLDNDYTVNGSETLSRHVLLLPEYTLSLFTEY